MQRQHLLSDSTRVSEAAILRRLTKIWLTTGAVPVAHMVAEPDEAEIPPLAKPSGRWRRAARGSRHRVMAATTPGSPPL